MKHKKGFKALAAAVLSISLLIGLVPATAFADAEDYRYVDKNGDDYALPEDATVLESVSNTGLTSGWYVITEDTVVNSRIEIHGDVTLVLATTGNDQTKFEKGIHVPKTSSLTIYKAKDYSGVMFISAPGSYSAGIGGDINEVNGDITFESAGFINVNGGATAAGIGTGTGASTSAQPGKISIEAGVGSMSVSANQGGKAISRSVSGPVGEISIYDAAIIAVGAENNLSITHDVSDCASNPQMTITKCTSHSGTDNYISISDTQHVLMCDYCRSVVETEDHDGSPCSKCGHTGEVITYKVTFMDGDTELDVAVVNAGEKISTSSIPEVTPPEGMELVGWKIKGSDNNFDVANTAVTEDITLVAVFDYACVATLTEKTVVFEGVLQIRYTMNISQDLWEDEGAYLSFTQAGKDEVKVMITEGDVQNSGEVYYYYPVPIPEYQDVVTVRVYNSEGNTVLFRHTSGDNYHEANEESPKGAEYSILSYIEAMSGGSAITPLVYALRYYGACAQKKFAYGENVEVEYTTPVFNVTATQRSDNQITTTGDRSDVNGLLKSSIQVNFEAGNDLRVSFTLEDGASVSDYAFTLDNKPIEPEQVGKNKYAIIVKNIAATDLDVKHDFGISDADGHTYTVNANVLSYALIAIDANTNEDTVYLCKALWKYSIEAEKYFKIPKT